ncbi:YTH domain-containing family protein 2-like isoform X1 [Chenopodium quinoa]|uniref:YTH domain-containing family protein 2-like isoform X1 n=1 Tax=Chenopodium quinoa TaxID=63459 RepID=UPI000B76EE63|nr:YTH domain-containing family protein 2-like isoform X1 [Chenopodium quinoa]
MVCEKPTELSKGADSGSILSKPAEKAMVASDNGISSDYTTPNQGASSVKGETGQESVAGQDVYNPPPSYYNYYYPGYNGTFGQSDDGRDHSSMHSFAMQGVQTNHSSIAYYMPGYNPYAAGTFVGADGHCVSQPFYTPVSTYGAEVPPCYAWDLNYLGDPSTGSNAAPGNVKSNPSPANVARSNGIKPSKLYGSLGKHSSTPVNSKSRPSVAAPNVSQPKFDTEPTKPLNKSGSYFPSAGYANVYHPAGNYQSLSFPKRGVFGNTGPMGYRSNARMWNGNDKFRPSRKSELEMSAELTCGPRANSKSNSDSSEKEPLGSAVQRYTYNLAEFQTEYEAAKLYVIKSYSEDDVHKCIKYDVWSSTANGNKKLDAAFHDAEVKASETGVNCPIFLFFSVNGSGQFVGVAEMTGQVDFNKNMDFWQLDKWSGFFPVKWHIVKDIPNSQLRHIILENNENRPVTYTRDTQEIGLKQGLEMLKIFKNYLSKTSLVDDLDFYEGREKSLQMKRSSKSGGHQTEVFGNGNLPKQVETEAKRGEELKSQVASVLALVNLTSNLSLSSDPKVVL